MGYKKIKHRPNSEGFTIVEVMIVLAVTSAMFVSMALAIGGRQQDTQFQSAVGELRAQLQQVSSEVVSGAYPSTNTFGCTNSGGAIQLSNTPNDTGSCVYLGKAVHFYRAGSADQAKYSVYSIVALDSTTTDYGTVHPTVVAQASSAPYKARTTDPVSGAPVDVTATSSLGYGIRVKTMTYTTSTGTGNVGSFAFVQSLNPNGLDGSGNAVADDKGASQYVRLIVPDSGNRSSLDNNASTEAYQLDNILENEDFTYAGTVAICVQDAGAKQKGVITVSASTNHLDITSKISAGSC